MNYPSRRGIRLNLKQVGGREGSSGKLIQTTHCPPSLFLPSCFLRFFPLNHPQTSPSFLLLLERPRLARHEEEAFQVISPRSKCREARELISNVLLFRQTSNPTRPDKCTFLQIEIEDRAIYIYISACLSSPLGARGFVEIMSLKGGACITWV